jgi:putative alpha-1,2-mannosidase
MIAPNLYTDVNGDYRGMDMKIHNTEGDKDQYTVFSLWDTFRATHPLFTIIEQDRTNAFVQTFLRQYEQGGLLPVWELAANETYCMIGYHSAPVIVDAYLKGIHDFDAEKALEAMVNSANQDHFGLEFYKKQGLHQRRR